MEVLERHSGENAWFTLFDCANGFLNLRKYLFYSRGVHNGSVHKIIYSIVKLHVHEDSLYCNDNSEIYFHKPFKYLLNFIDVWLGTCWTVTKYIPCDMVINNGVTFTKIISTTRVTSLCNLKNSLGTEI